jgi:Tol biopolymer transport system component
VRFSVPPPEKGVFVTPLLTGSASPVGGAISPDGRTLAFTASDASGRIQLWIRPLDSTEARALPRTDGAALPFWSPDGKALGFFGSGTLLRIDLADDAIQVLARLQRGRGGSWSRDGVIVFAPALGGPLRRVNATGGESQPATTLRPGQRSHRFPYFLPDGRHFLYYAEGSLAEDTGVFIGDLETSTERRMLAADSGAIYAAPGRLLFVRQGTLLAQPFDEAVLQMAGEPVSLASSISTEGAWPAFSASSTGVLTYRSGPPEVQQFAWFDRTGRLLETIGPPGNYRGVDLSPDGTRIAVHHHEGDGGDIWVIEPRGTTTRITSDPARDNSSPVWSPDGTRLAFGSLRDGKWGLYQKRAILSDPDELLTESPVPKIPSHWSAGGLAFWLLNANSDAFDTHLLAFDAGRARPDATPILASRFYEGHAQVSRDGKWMAYMSLETGRAQIHVRSFPSGDGASQVSTNGGVTPRWGRDGRELFYVSSYDSGQLMAAPVRIEGNRLVPGTPKALFSTGLITPPHSTSINVYHTYAVSPDSQRFLIPRPAPMLRDDATPTPITVVLNWPTMLER